MSFDQVPPSDEKLRAFDRGLLPPEEIDAVTRWLEAHPEAEEALTHLTDGPPDDAVEALRQPCAIDAELAQLSALATQVVERVLAGVEQSPALAPGVPRRIREYQLLRPLGRGGMGSVYLARHTRLKRDVALKLLLGHALSDPRFRARFEREMAVVGQLDHPHLIRAHDAGVEGPHLFLAMELLDGSDLARLVAQRGPLPLADACEVLRQASLGLDHAHAHALVHRDVKPANLFLTRAGIVKVIDLGLARVLDEPARSKDLSSANIVMGTPECMAPEQWVSMAVDQRADLYALGCTLFILLTGRPPLAPQETDSWVAWCDAHRWQPPPDLRDKLPSAPAEVAELVAALLAKDPKERPASARKVADRLAPLAAGHSLGRLFLSQAPCPPSEAATPTHRLLPRRRRVLAAAAIGLLALAAGGLLTAYLILRVGGEKVGQETAFAKETVKSFDSQRNEIRHFEAWAAARAGLKATPIRQRAIGSAAGVHFEAVLPEQSLLVGVSVTTVLIFGRNQVVGSVQPIYLTRQGIHADRRIGEAAGPVSRTVAKEGYAVGAIVVSAGAAVDKVKLVFMRIDGARLNPNDRYESAWLGGPGGAGVTLLGGNDKPVIGIHGTLIVQDDSSHFLGSLGLVQLDSSSDQGP
jgi:serine/threonine protein kinase